MTLEDYLAGEYNRDIQDIAAIELVLKDVARTLSAAYDEQAGCWPYELKADQDASVGNPSHGTSAMILAAVGKMAGFCRLRDDSIPEKLYRQPEETERLANLLRHGVSRLAEQIAKDGAIRSGTFGDHDPLTISHLTELARGLRKGATKDAIKIAIDKTEAARKIAALMGMNPSVGRYLERELGAEWCTRSAFVALRIVRADADLSQPVKTNAEAYKDFFESRLHEHLSFSSIPDSRFDPAELAFCLEGLLICAREAVDPVLFERVYAVLKSQQDTSAYWRPIVRSGPTREAKSCCR
jgi:hypothetical protein